LLKGVIFAMVPPMKTKTLAKKTARRASRPLEALRVRKPAAKPITSDRDDFLERLNVLHADMRSEGLGFTAEGWETFSKIIAGEG